MVDTESLDIQPIPARPDLIKISYKLPSEPKDPSLYQLGDDINDYLRVIPKYDRNLPEEYKSKNLEILEAAIDRMRATNTFLGSVSVAIEKKNELVAMAGRIQSLQKMADSIRDRRESTKAQASVSRQVSVTGSPEASAVGVKSRMQGVDVSALPSGFGKRRSSASLGGGKRPKSPTEGAPVLKKPTPTESPEDAEFTSQLAAKFPSQVS